MLGRCAGYTAVSDGYSKRAQGVGSLCTNPLAAPSLQIIAYMSWVPLVRLPLASYAIACTLSARNLQYRNSIFLYTHHVGCAMQKYIAPLSHYPSVSDRLES